jgi:hypothetical protein
MNPRETLLSFNRYLAERALRFEGVIVGGAALNLSCATALPTSSSRPSSPATITPTVTAC